MKKYVELCETLISVVKGINKESSLEIYKQVSLLFIPLVFSFIAKLLFNSYLVIDSVLNVVYLFCLISIILIIGFRLKYEMKLLLKLGLCSSLVINIILLIYTVIEYIDIKISLATYSLNLDSLQTVNISIVELLVLIVIYVCALAYSLTHLSHKD